MRSGRLLSPAFPLAIGAAMRAQASFLPNPTQASDTGKVLDLRMLLPWYLRYCRFIPSEGEEQHTQVLGSQGGFHAAPNFRHGSTPAVRIALCSCPQDEDALCPSEREPTEARGFAGTPQICGGRNRYPCDLA